MMYLVIAVVLTTATVIIRLIRFGLVLFFVALVALAASGHGSAVTHLIHLR